MKWNALETDSISLRIHLSIRQALREYMIAVGKNTTYRKKKKNYVGVRGASESLAFGFDI